MPDIVRRLAAALVLSMIAVVLTADPFCCADGCTDAPHAAVSTVSTSCSLCQNSVTVPSVSAAVTFALVRQSFNEPPRRSLSLLTGRIDHPPRLT